MKVEYNRKKNFGRFVRVFWRGALALSTPARYRTFTALLRRNYAESRKDTPLVSYCIIGRTHAAYHEASPLYMQPTHPARSCCAALTS